MNLITPNNWLNWFLNKRKIAAPDGRILFRYKVKDSEYNSLQAILNSNQDYTESWNACFVLYASEYWRRNYTEGHWSWDFITNSLGNSASIGIQSVGFRSKTIESGINYWKRSIYKTGSGHNGYLSTIILECGLPEGILTRSGHWLTQVIVSAYEELRAISISELEPREVVQRTVEQKEQFPDSLKKEEIYELIAQITQAAIQLKHKYKLAKERSPTDFLNTVAPDWKASFPIQVSPATASFLDQLLTEVAKLPEPRKYEISIERELVKIGLEWVVNATLKFPDGFYDYEDLHLAKQEQALIRPVSNVKIKLASADDTGTKEIYTAFKTLKNSKEGFSIRGIDEHQLGKNAGLHSWILRCTNYEHDVDIELPLPGGETLDNELPWAFVEKDGCKLFKRAGSVSVKATTIYVVADRLWAKDGSYQMVGSLNGDKDIYQVTGECSITAGGQTFLYRTNVESDTGYFYTLQGKKLNYQSQQGDELYLGLPTLHKVDSDNLNKAPVRKQIYVIKRGENQRYGECKNEIGILRIQVLGEHSEVLFSKKVNVLPSNFSVSIESLSPVEGKINLEHSSHFAISLEGDGLVGEIENRESGHSIWVKSKGEVPPKNIAISLSGGGNTLTLKVPFPSRGAKFFDKHENVLAEGEKLYLNDLFGYSLSLFNAASTWKVYNLILSLTGKEGSGIRIFRKIEVDQFQREVPLIRYRDDFLKLLSITETLDAEVRMRVEHGPSVTVRGYSTFLKLHANESTVTLLGSFQDLSHTEINAFRFDESLKNQEVCALSLVSMDEDEGAWSFLEKDKQPGKWLLFPDAESAIQFRPRLWIMEQETEQQPISEITHIQEASGISTTSQRIEVLAGLAKKMSQNLDNTNWQEVSHLWKITKHLPLSTFDLWTAFTRNDEALVSLLFFQENELVDRLSNEYPILWETVPIKVWIDGATSRYKHFNNQIPDYANDLIDDKFQYIESQLKLTCVAAILKSEVLGLDAPDLSAMANLDIVNFQFNLLLNGGPGCHGLKNRKAEEGRWPVYLSQEIRSIMGRLPQESKSLLPSVINHRIPVIFLPVVLAASTVNQTLYAWNESSYTQIFQLREIQSFDEEWFRAMYDLMQGYYWINHKLI